MNEWQIVLLCLAIWVFGIIVTFVLVRALRDDIENSEVTEPEIRISVLWPLFVPFTLLIQGATFFFGLLDKLATKMRDETKKDDE